ncbi:nucleotidyl transferase AbiEii/AbiGii toxin family protein [candidate division WOR-3 bacterium]|nr:nucleotidyl transferase AbiEii/AbiGii toxin family protein [candidate division WOR-3 bacterium]
MFDIKQIESFYPEYLRAFKKNLLREYIQYKILEIIYDSKFGEKLSFMGGTAIRVIHSHTRFSEDLDFDNLGLNKEDFKQLVELIQRKLKLEGYTAEIKNVFKGAYRSYIRIIDVLFEYGLSGHKEEKLLIQFDTEPQEFEYEPGKVIINKFDVFIRINVVPLDILLAQKIYAIFKRRRAMGRDFYDAVFLFGKTKPNFDYLKLKLKIKNMDYLKARLLSKCESLDFKRLAKETEPFLFTPGDSKKVLYFCDYIKDIKP